MFFSLHLPGVRLQGQMGGEAPWRNLLLKAGPDSQMLSTGEKLYL